jgi:hypothetical protein
MNKHLFRRARIAPHLLAVASFALLAGCITSNEPILTDAQPLLGTDPQMQLYTLRDGAAHEPLSGGFHWQDGRYVAASATLKDINPFTMHAFEGADLIVQGTKPGQPTEYAIARKLADGTYLAFVIDEKDADDATRAKYCAADAGAACRVTTREAVLAFAHATAAKPHTTGGLAILLGQ